MGNSSSNQIQPNLQAMALNNFNIRINSYSYPHHGPYQQYLDLCIAQYQLECIPKGCLHGKNYTPRYDDYGNHTFL